MSDKITEDRKVDLNIPIIFQKLDDITDSRFTNVKIWLMHLGKNLNSSYFSKEAVEKAIPSLSNTPILGYIEDNSNGEEDFSDHRIVLEKDDGKYSFKYKGSAYGVIPENNNAKFEKRMCDDGVEREFLTVEGLMWNKWDDPIDIISRDHSKAQSMEIHSDYDGEFDKDGVFCFTNFSFFGACLLGHDVKPAMSNASVEIQFSYDDFKQEIQEKMEEYKLLVAQRSTTPVETLVTNELDNDESDNESSDKLELGTDNFSVVKNSEDGEEIMKNRKKKNVSEKFELTSQQLASALTNALADAPDDESSTDTNDYWYDMPDFWYVDHTATMVVAYDTEEYELVGFNYTMDGDYPVIDWKSKLELKIEYVPLTGNDPDADDDTQEAEGTATNMSSMIPKSLSDYKLKNEKQKIKSDYEANNSEVTAKFDTLSSEVVELREFKKTKSYEARKAAVVELVEKFSQLSEEDTAEIKANAFESDEPLEDVENKLFALVGKKAFTANTSFSVNNKQKGSLKIGVTDVVNVPSGKSYEGIIAKHIGK